MLLHRRYLIPALRMTKTATKVSILKLLNNLLVTKGTDTADVLSRWPDFADIIRELVTTGVEPTVVKSLAHRLHMSLQVHVEIRRGLNCFLDL